MVQWRDPRANRRILPLPQTSSTVPAPSSNVVPASPDAAMASSSNTPAGAVSVDRKPTARVVGVLARNWRPFVCTLQLDSSVDPAAVAGEVANIEDESQSAAGASVSGRYDYAIFVPMNVRIPKIRVRTRQAKLLANARVLISIDSWDTGSRYPAGHFVMRLGRIGDLETEVQCILWEEDIHHGPFAPGLLADLPPREDPRVGALSMQQAIATAQARLSAVNRPKEQGSKRDRRAAPSAVESARTLQVSYGYSADERVEAANMELTPLFAVNLQVSDHATGAGAGAGAAAVQAGAAPSTVPESRGTLQSAVVA